MYRYLLPLIVLTSSLHADVKLPAIFSDHAVLEKTAKVPIWGKADPEEKIRITLGKSQTETTADADGKWMASLDLSHSATGPFELVVEGKNKLVLTDVLVGDVWLCSGQSNMAFALQSATDGKETAAQVNNPELRLFTVERKTSVEPLDDCMGKWTVASPEAAAAFSAVGFYFGSTLQNELHIPIGLIHSSWGGTPSEAWTSAEALDQVPDLKKTREAMMAEIASYPERREAFLTGLPAWEKKMQRVDRESQSLPDDEGWAPLHLPGKISGPGAAWIRRSVKISPELVGSRLRLELRGVSGLDTVYWNGKKIGGTDFEHSLNGPDRTYTLPSNQAGEFTLLIRLFSSTQNIGIAGPIQIGKGFSLAGEWQTKPDFSLPELDKTVLAQVPPNPGKDPLSAGKASVLFNGMIHPIVPYALKGVIWYQGESNAGRAYQYRTAFPLMITDWRAQWNQGDFPFYFCQIANFMGKTSDFSDANWAELREAQTKTLALPNTGQAILIDVGEEADIHPRDKKTVGQRLALIALARDYGKSVAFSGPIFDSMKIQNGKAILTFKDTQGGLVAKPLPESYAPKAGAPEKPLKKDSPNSELQGFAVCGEDQKWVWANAKIDGDQVIVSSPEVVQPVAVRYAWAQNPTCNLYNGAGLPAGPFRTDDFPISTRDKKY